jgi:hypothetical protein
MSPEDGWTDVASTQGALSALQGTIQLLQLLQQRKLTIFKFEI